MIFNSSYKSYPQAILPRSLFLTIPLSLLALILGTILLVAHTLMRLLTATTMLIANKSRLHFHSPKRPRVQRSPVTIDGDYITIHESYSNQKRSRGTSDAKR